MSPEEICADYNSVPEEELGRDAPILRSKQDIAQFVNRVRRRNAREVRRMGGYGNAQ